MNGAAPGRVAIVGGGIIGAAAAYYLQRDGWNVTILDKHRFGAACSHGNCGFVCPSHMLPLAEPGAVKSTFKALLSRNSPFSIKPRLDLALWSWLWQFSRKCNRTDMLAGGNALNALLTLSMSMYEQLIAEESLTCEWHKRGLLFVYRDSQQFEDYAKTNDLIGEHWNAAARKVSADELHDLEPALKTGLAGGWHHEHDAHLRADRLMASLRSLLESRGVQILEQCDVLEIERRRDTAVRLLTSQDDVEADLFVVAAGALTPALQPYLGCRIPIQPGKGYSITMPRPKICPAIPMLFPETRVGATPFDTGFRLGSIMEFAGYDTSIKPQRLKLLTDGAAPFLREPTAEPVQEQWYGWRPMTYDSLPVIDRSPIMGNVLIAAGHNMLGLSMAPATGKLIADLAAGRKPFLDLTPYAVTRF